jgi:hypothetical protein
LGDLLPKVVVANPQHVCSGNQSGSWSFSREVSIAHTVQRVSWELEAVQRSGEQKQLWEIKSWLTTTNCTALGKSEFLSIHFFLVQKEKDNSSCSPGLGWGLKKMPTKHLASTVPSME